MNKNRLLKFRFWNKDQNKFIDAPRVWTRINGELMYDFNGQELIVQQFTGLLDKDGKEIYEGDILKVWLGGDLQADHYHVKDMRELYFEFNREDSYLRLTKCEVIGNIFGQKT